ncbi:TetR/AcrR family transcriptional regulator [Aromatoleum anaerobium]|uniref:TetR family transcriptional regulator n=1 Tax=Aromatoleum anaerobium TaxID=182180 RepID=A0ABX1PNE5_9RHOO|nr:TetR/AcrR family transcriptional regulator [Aromatoleum anaerobium]MCK0506565.1 TetR/AcrR family transcriptional regulator [Aromatoleum anaerobium]
MQPCVVSNVDDPALVEMRRSQFVKAASELFARKGYHRTTIRDITQSAGLSTGLIYSYVRAKEDVLFLVLENVLKSYLAEIPRALEAGGGPVERFCATVRAYCEVIGDKPDATQLAYRETKSLGADYQTVIKNMELETNQLIIDRIEECIDAGYFRPVNVELLTYRIVLLAHGWALKAWRLQQFTTLDEYIDEGLDLFLNALLTPEGWAHYREVREGRGVQ